MPGGTGISVSELNRMVAEAIRQDPRTRSVTVRGEISGFKHHIASGHWYFSLKDEESSVSCVMFRMNTLRAALKPREGDSVLVTGHVDVYQKTGSCQLYVTGMMRDGQGDLYLRFEALKQKLAAENLFDPARKRPLPMVPRKVAVVTSASGAALHDILNVSRQRSPFIPIVLIPVTVQGETAAAEIVRGIRQANALAEPEVIIVARGGGSQEDLWCFNEEAVARAVAASRLPVVSGVGHETDITICDLVADVRASTPSNAAEIVFPDRRELAGRTGMLRMGLARAARNALREKELQLHRLRETLGALSEERRIRNLQERSRLLRERLTAAGKALAERNRIRLEQDEIRLRYCMRQQLEAAGTQVMKSRERLTAISPVNVLKRGYAMVLTPGETVIPTAAEARKETRMILRFADGRIGVRKEEENA